MRFYGSSDWVNITYRVMLFILKGMKNANAMCGVRKFDYTFA
ncbi:hypothetical protein [Bacillus thuringiensis]|nr:hypothetical protein [Bacillus thuringiensis]